MKTSEFIKQVEELGYVTDKDNWYVYVRNKRFTVAMVSETRVNAIDANYSYADVPNKLFDLIVEYAKTPLEDREEDKLFTAKYLITGQYLSKLGGGKFRWLFEPSNFTEDELYKLGITYDSPEYEIKPVEDNIKWREE